MRWCEEKGGQGSMLQGVPVPLPPLKTLSLPPVALRTAKPTFADRSSPQSKGLHDPAKPQQALKAIRRLQLFPNEEDI